MHMHDWVEHEGGIHACTVRGCNEVGIEKETTIGGGGDIEQDVPYIKVLEPLAMAVHLAQMCEDLDFFKDKHYDMPQALYESREGVRSDLGL
mgnify:FL=1